MHIRTTCFVYLLFIFVTIFFLFIPFSHCFAGADPEPDLKSSIIINPDKQFNFAEYYFSNKNYLMAVAEYNRFIYFFPEDQRVETAMYRIGMSYYLGRHFKEAVNSFRAVIDRYVDTELSIKSYFMISEAHVNLNTFGPAIINLNNLITITHDEDVKDEAYYRIGWICIETASWEKARLYFSRISAKNKDKYRLERLNAELNKERSIPQKKPDLAGFLSIIPGAGRLERLNAELNKERSIPQKKPDLAGFLSIIPGAGYLYCERYQDALIAFLLNGGLILAAYKSFDNDNNALGGVIAFVEFGFYAGNIYGAVASAHKYNRKKTGQFIEKLKNNAKINLSADVENKGVCFAFKFVF
jgi:tetratricopeptide (TPR) repeat protein